MKTFAKYLTLNNASAVLGCGALLLLSIYLSLKNVELNLASFLCWLGLDIVVLAKYLRDNVKETGLVIGYTAGATLVSIALLFAGTWQWGVIEWVVSLLCVACGIAIFNVKSSAHKRLVLVVTVVAMTIAGIPSVTLAYHRESFDLGIALFWGACGFAGALQIMAVKWKEWSFDNTFYPATSFAFNVLMTYLVIF